MAMLVKWLRKAEANAGAASEKFFGEKISELDETQSLRRFGDGYAPDISELKVSSEALLAASSSPGAGAFGLAEAALSAALAQAEDIELRNAEVSVEKEGAGDAHSDVAELIESTGASPTPAGVPGD